MSERDNLEQERQTAKLDKESEPQAGEGPRSLHNWQNMAKARQSLSADPNNQEHYKADPIAYMQRFGVDVGNMVAPGQSPGGNNLQLQSLEAQSGEGADMQLAFCKVWGIVIVVAAAAAAAAVVVNAGAAANVVVLANAAANANATANVNGVGPADAG